jgi:hypothetical protein
MIFAICNNEKIEAAPKLKAICQSCDKEVFAKCGEVNVWHWAHHKNESCDSWYEPETLWHKNWKLVFGKENSEVVIKKEGTKHIADIFSKNEVVIELQNSKIPKQIIRRREVFYGDRMIWLINGIRFEENFSTRKRIMPSNWTRTFEGWVNVVTGEIRSLLDDMDTKDYDFLWSWSRKSWKEVNRPVFIDFGHEDLFWVKGGMGSSSGYGRWIKKILFIEKYEGDLTMVNLVLNNPGNSI